MIIQNTIKQASLVLKNNKIPSHQLDAEIILSKIMGVTREFLLTKNNLNISKEMINKYNHAIKRRTKTSRF